jgi:hypothetical protein
LASVVSREERCVFVGGRLAGGILYLQITYNRRDAEFAEAISLFLLCVLRARR